jgi:sulfur carrier protein
VNITVNGTPREVADDISVAELLAELGSADATRGIAVAVDGTVVPRAGRVSTRLAEGARVEVVTAVQGG